MKTFFIVSFAVLIISCESEKIQQEPSSHHILTDDQLPKGMQISFDTLYIPIDGHLDNLALHQGKFYCLFQKYDSIKTDNITSFFYSKKLLQLGLDGNYKEIFMNKDFQKMNFFHLTEKNDTLFLIDNWYGKTYFLGKNIDDFLQTDRINPSIFQNNQYKIYSVCFGEFGGKILFQDIHTGEVFKAASTCAFIINEIENEYFITSYLGHLDDFTSVVKIVDPSKLEKKEKLNFEWEEEEYIEGDEILLDTIGFQIQTSFVVNKELLHIYRDKEGTYIGKIKERQMESIYKFNFDFDIFLNQRDEKNRQILIFNITNPEQEGILIIDGKKMKFYIINQI